MTNRTDEPTSRPREVNADFIISPTVNNSSEPILHEVDHVSLILSPMRTSNSATPRSQLRVADWRLLNERFDKVLPGASIYSNHFIQAVLKIHSKVLSDEGRDLHLAGRHLHRVLDAFPFPAIHGFVPGIGWAVVFDDGTFSPTDWTICPGVFETTEVNGIVKLGLPYLAEYCDHFPGICQADHQFTAQKKCYRNLKFLMKYGEDGSYWDTLKEILIDYTINNENLENDWLKTSSKESAFFDCCSPSEIVSRIFANKDAWVQFGTSSFSDSVSSLSSADLINKHISGEVAHESNIWNLPFFPEANEVVLEKYRSLLVDLSVRISTDEEIRDRRMLSISYHFASDDDFSNDEESPESLGVLKEIFSCKNLHDINGGFYWVDVKVTPEILVGAFDKCREIMCLFQEVHDKLGTPEFWVLERPNIRGSVGTLEEWIDNGFDHPHPIGARCGHLDDWEFSDGLPDKRLFKLPIGTTIFRDDSIEQRDELKFRLLSVLNAVTQSEKI